MPGIIFNMTADLSSIHSYVKWGNHSYTHTHAHYIKNVWKSYSKSIIIIIIYIVIII